MKKTISIFSYPVVLKSQGGELMWICPDFGIYRVVNKKEDKINSALAANIGLAWLKIMTALYREIKNKEESGIPLPNPSNTSDLFDFKKNNEKTYSPPEISKILGVSVNTIRRSIDKKVVNCIVTEGGHRRLTESQIKDLGDFLRRRAPDLSS